jgi:uncharacterized DUF497 family protein
MRIEWDPAKSASNKTKHGIAFERAQLVFDDPCCVTFPERAVDGEERWHTIGLIAGIVIIVVVHTYRVEESEGKSEEVVRIISARRATRREREIYAQVID